MRAIWVAVAVMVILAGCSKGGPPLENKHDKTPVLDEGGWEQLRWGMTPAEVQEASHGKLKVSTGDEAHRRATWTVGNSGPYSTTNYMFEAYAYQGRDGLTAVVLERKGGENCDRLSRDIEKKYGSYVDATITGSSQFDHEWLAISGNLYLRYVQDMQSPTDCTLIYEPKSGREQRGL